MKYYSTNKEAPIATLEEAVVKGLAPDKGLYMPENINKLPKTFFDNIQDMSFQEIAFEVAKAFFGDDVETSALKDIVYDTLSFDVPAIKVEITSILSNYFMVQLLHSRMLVQDLWLDFCNIS